MYKSDKPQWKGTRFTYVFVNTVVNCECGGGNNEQNENSLNQMLDELGR